MNININDDEKVTRSTYICYFFDEDLQYIGTKVGQRAALHSEYTAKQRTLIVQVRCVHGDRYESVIKRGDLEG